MNKELNHIGVLGMKWGRRKAKNMVDPRKIEKARQKEAKKRAKILASPDKLRKNLDKFSDKEIEQAVKKMRLERDLRGLNRDKIARGSNYAGAILAYGTTAVTAYGIYKSPLGQRIKDMVVEAMRR